MKLKHLFIASLSFALLGATSEAVFAAKPARKKAKTTKTTKNEIPKTEQGPELFFIDDSEFAERQVEMQEREYNGEIPVGYSDNIIEAKSVEKEIPIERPVPPPPPVPAPVDENKVFDSVEQDPIFPGGQAALVEYVNSHIKYPKVAMENGIQGRVVVQFVVTKTGSIGQVKVVRGKDPELDKEAVRVIKALPKFTPGKMNGHAVNCWYTFPVHFKIQDK